MAQHIEQLHFHATSHCALCRTRLPEPDYDTDSEPPESKVWEYEVLALCDISSSEKHPQIFTTRADFKNPGTFTACITTERSSLSIELCLESECRQCKGGGVAHIIHIPCWKLINTSGERHSAASIYEFAQSRYPLFDAGDAFDSEHNTLMDFTNTTAEGLGDTNLGYLLGRFLGLPAEIRSIISANCPPSLLSSLHTVSRISPLDVAECRSSRTVIEYKYDTTVNFLGATQTWVLGQQYISSVVFNKIGGILVKRADFGGIRFTIGRYGLRALSILYADGSTSAWLGDPTNGWTGVMYTNDVRKFHVLHDNLKYLRIDLKDEEAGSKAASRVMWDKVLNFTSGQHHYILDMATNRSQVRNFPGWRLCEYLPFIDNSSSISGLTMYCNGHGVTGMVAHSQVQRQIGQCQGCPVHFYLQPNERIVSIWLRMPAYHVPVENEPSILVTTNFSRSCVFGPCLPQPVITGCQYAWVPLTRGSDVLGIFYDALAIKRCGRITNVGFSQDVKPQHKFVAEDLPRIPFPRHRPDIGQDMITGIYFSNSKLDQIKRLRICQRGSRCTGMSIDRYDGGVDVLGQWDNQHSTISEIYNEQDGFVSRITFRFLKGASGFYVDGIFVSIDNENPPEITVTEHSKLVSLELPSQYSVVWWFSRDYDEIELWEAMYQEINVSTERYNIIELE